MKFHNSSSSNVPIQVDELSMNGFDAVGFGTFLNFSFPLTDASYVSVERGIDAFSKNKVNVYFAPVVAGHRYTIDSRGIGFYATDNQIEDQNGDLVLVISI